MVLLVRILFRGIPPNHGFDQNIPLFGWVTPEGLYTDRMIKQLTSSNNSQVIPIIIRGVTVFAIGIRLFQIVTYHGHQWYSADSFPLLPTGKVEIMIIMYV